MDRAIAKSMRQSRDLLFILGLFALFSQARYGILACLIPSGAGGVRGGGLLPN